MRLSILCLLGISGVAIAQPPDIRAHLISVGQGDSTLFEFPGCGVMLIDAGATLNQPETPLTNYLAEFFGDHPEFNNTIDLVINTHQHDDHLRSLSMRLPPRTSSVAMSITARRSPQIQS